MIILDTNVLISALIKDSTTRKILLESGLNFCYPAESFYELEKYKELIIRKAEIPEKEYKDLFNNLLNHIMIISKSITDKFLIRADKIMSHIDPTIRFSLQQP